MSLDEQMVVFVWTLAIGMLTGFCYVVYSAVRDMLRLKKAGTFAGDLIFWLIVTVIAFIMLLKANYGQFRLYVFIGLFIGAFLFSRFLRVFAYKLAWRVFYMAGRTARLFALFFYYVWQALTFPFRIIFIIVIFPVRLTCGVMGRAGRLAGKLFSRPVNRIKDHIAVLAGGLLKKFIRR